MKTQNQNKAWTQEDTDLLMNSKKTIATVARKLKRTPKACSMRRYTVKQYALEISALNKKKNKWTASEDKFLIDNPRASLKVLKARLTRTDDAIRMRRSKLNLTRAYAQRNPIIAASAVAVMPAFTYEGRHTIKTDYQMGWLTRVLLGVKVAA